MKIAAPLSITQAVAYSAARMAKEYTNGRNWASGVSISPIFGVGYVGLRTDKRYLMYQEMGTNPFLMLQLEGKTVPIKGPDGLHFVKVRGVGKPGFVTLPGGVKVWRNQKWRHPGIKPTNFMRNSIQAAIVENKPMINSLMQSLIGIQGNVQPW